MSLDNGVYIITSKASGNPVSRYPIETLVLEPKQVFVLPPGLQALPLIVKNSNDGHQILAGGAPTGVLKQKVYAFLLGEQSEDWVITAQPQHGDNVYTIETKDRSTGWVVNGGSDDDRNEIAVHPLIVGLSDPPFFPPNQLFTFIRVD